MLITRCKIFLWGKLNLYISSVIRKIRVAISVTTQVLCQLIDKGVLRRELEIDEGLIFFFKFIKAYIVPSN